MRLFSILALPISAASVENDATFLLQSQVLRSHMFQNETVTLDDYLRCPSSKGKNCPGNDLGKPTQESSAEACCSKCHSTSGCNGYVFNTAGQCWLKNTCQKFSAGDGGVVSAGPIYRKSGSQNWCPAIKQLNCPGNDLPNQPHSPAQNFANGCCDACHSTPGCNGFVFNAAGECWLKNACENPVTGDSSVVASGPIKKLNWKTGLVCPAIRGLNCPLNDLTRLPTVTDSQFECCDLCYATEGCLGFVYNSEKQCYLKRKCDNPILPDASVIASGSIEPTPPGWKAPSPSPPPYPGGSPGPGSPGPGPGSPGPGPGSPGPGPGSPGPGPASPGPASPGPGPASPGPGPASPGPGPASPGPGPASPGPGPAPPGPGPTSPGPGPVSPGPAPAPRPPGKAENRKKAWEKKKENKVKRIAARKKKCAANMAKYAKCAAKPKCEKQYKASGKKEPNCNSRR